MRRYCHNFPLMMNKEGWHLMAKKVPPIPKSEPLIIPYLSVKGAREAIRWYTKVLGGKFLYQIDMPGGLVGHAEIAFGRSKIMLAEENPAWDNRSPLSIGGSPVKIHLYVEDVDKIYRKAIKAGARSSMEPRTEFYGNRAAQFTDPFGHTWMIATQVEALTPREMKRRAKKLFG